MTNRFAAFLSSFQFRIFLAMLLITAIFVPATGYIGYHQASKAVQDQMMQYADSTARQLELQLHTISLQPGNQTKRFQELGAKSPVLFVLFDKNGLAQGPFSQSEQKHFRLLAESKEQLEKNGRQAGIVRVKERQYFAFTRTLAFRNWSVVLAFPATNYLEQIQFIKKMTMSFIVAAILLAAVLSYLLSKSIMTPLLKLRQGIDRIGIGALEHRVTINTPDVARDLAHSFNTMADSLQKSLNELKATYAELQEKEKLAAVGKMTAGIAHEIKNPLGIILGSTQVVLDSQRPWEMREKAASFIMDEVVRLDTTLKAFLDFARPATPVLVETSVAEIFEETLSAIEDRYRREGYIFQRDFQPNLPLMEADPAQLRQILMNILFNAFNAMPDGGKVTIGIRSEKEPEMGPADNAKTDKRFISTRNPFTVARDWLIITIADTGCGIEKNQLPKILDPFISFRDDGIGLGLSIVNQLVKLHRGHMKIDSEAGQGTTFTLFFPCILKEPAQPENL